MLMGTAGMFAQAFRWLHVRTGAMIGAKGAVFTACVSDRILENVVRIL